jgi:hypothetical protein
MKKRLLLASSAFMLSSGAFAQHALGTMVPEASCKPPNKFIQRAVSSTGEKLGSCIMVTPVVPVCASTPKVEVDSASVMSIPVRSGRLIDWPIAGAVKLESGCSLKSAAFKLDDEYGVMNKTGEVMVGPDGRFSFVVSVEGFRKGTDKDGRTYTVAVTASNEAGSATSGPVTATVEHDSRKQ